MDLRSRFGLHQVPFTREISTQNHLPLSFVDEALEALLGCVERRMCGALIAPAGTGKTALLRRLCERLPEARYETTYVKVTGLSKRDMCREIARACGAESAGTYASLVDRLQRRFESSLGCEGRRPVLLLDEAHDLRPEVLRMLRVLTNFEMDSRLVVSIIVVGQLPLRRMLAQDEQASIARRIARYTNLRLLSRDESTRYIKHRCAVAGAVQAPFDDAAYDAIYELSRGNLRAIDRLALEGLLIADREGHDVVDTRHITTARQNLWP